jgi:hypothetical protein
MMQPALAVPLLDGVSCAVGLAETLAHQRWVKPRVGSVSATGGREAHGIGPALAALMGHRLGASNMTLNTTTTARALSALVQARGVTAAAVAEHFITRVEARNPALNALVQFHPDQVRADAADVDRRLAAGAKLPLAGVPVTVKDNVWVAGYVQQQGSRLFDGFVAPRDAWVVGRLEALGAVVLGITNCSEFACKGNTVNLVYGATRHPHDPTLTPGGSSGGAAAALAAGLGLVAIAPMRAARCAGQLRTPAWSA